MNAADAAADAISDAMMDGIAATEPARMEVTMEVGTVVVLDPAAASWVNSAPPSPGSCGSCGPPIPVGKGASTVVVTVILGDLASFVVERARNVDLRSLTWSWDQHWQHRSCGPS